MSFVPLITLIVLAIKLLYKFEAELSNENDCFEIFNNIYFFICLDLIRLSG